MHNLINEPWIPVISTDGKNRMVSIRQAFEEGRSIRCIDGDTISQTNAILRLLIAIIHRTYTADRYQDEYDAEDAWLQMLTANPKDTEIPAYLDKWQGKFELIDDQNPFMQQNGLGPENPVEPALYKLIPDFSSKAASIGRAASPKLTWHEAARWVIWCQSYASSGTQSLSKGDTRGGFGKMTPPGPGWVATLPLTVLHGANLWETMILNWVPSPLLVGSTASWADDSAIWERPTPTGFYEPGYDLGKNTNPAKLRGPATLMTWRSRGITLHWDENGMCDGAFVGACDRLNNQCAAWGYETMAPFNSINASKKPGLPVHMSFNKPLWTNANQVWLRNADIQRPMNIEWASRCVQNKVFSLSVTRYDADKYVSSISSEDHEIIPVAMAVVAQGDLSVTDRWMRETKTVWDAVSKVCNYAGRIVTFTSDRTITDTAARNRMMLWVRPQVDVIMRRLSSNLEVESMDKAFSDCHTTLLQLLRACATTACRHAPIRAQEGRIEKTENGDKLINASTMLRSTLTALKKLLSDSEDTTNKVI